MTLAYIHWDITALVCGFLGVITAIVVGIITAFSWISKTANKAENATKEIGIAREEMRSERKRLEQEVAKLNKLKKAIGRLVRESAMTQTLREAAPSNVISSTSEISVSPKDFAEMLQKNIQKFYTVTDQE